jgi:menaquinone-dependent protoporphyrinogen oxidase
MKVAIVYGTTEGHTRLIAQRIAEWLSKDGHELQLVDSAAVPADLDLGQFEAFIVAGSIHAGKHQAPLIHFAKTHAPDLREKPSAFISANLTAVLEDESHSAEVQACIERFFQETDWVPTLYTPVAGALLYTQYDWLKRMLIRAIVKQRGGDTDTSHDYEYTDWEALRQFVNGFVEQAQKA